MFHGPGIFVVIESIDPVLLAQSPAWFFRVADALPDCVFIKDKRLRYRFVNRAFASAVGVTADECIGKRALDFFDSEIAHRYEASDRLALESGQAVIEVAQLHATDRERWMHAARIPMRGDSGSLLVGFFTDVTAEKRQETAHSAAADTYRQFFDRLELSALMLDGEGRILYCNAAFGKVFGYDPSEVIGRDWLEMANTGDSLTVERERFRSHVSGEHPSLHFVKTMLTRDGQHRVIEWDVTALFRSDGALVGTAGIGQDVTELFRQRASLQRSNYAHAALSKSNNALVRATTEAELIQGVCDAVTMGDAYPAAFFARKSRAPDEPVVISSTSGRAHANLKKAKFNWSEGPLGKGPAGTALREGTTQILTYLLRSDRYLPWYGLAAEAGLQSMIALPIRIDGTTAAVLGVYGSEPDAFGPEEVELFEELARDLSFGIKQLRVNRGYRDALERDVDHTRYVNALLSKTIGAVASVAEHRDPYTAQHQERVAMLASAIATELGLDERTVDGIHLAATIHDIGKIEVPSDILTKPRKLTPAEFELVKLHPNVGYDILKDIEFPWPIAEMVRQHHEYLDGSGYPHGLRGDEILLQSRILTVADIVDAVASHRPYRPALGLEAAIAIVRERAETQLDPAVVEACAALVGSGRFTF